MLVLLVRHLECDASGARGDQANLVEVSAFCDRPFLGEKELVLHAELKSTHGFGRA
jgi:hypothetical protein